MFAMQLPLVTVVDYLSLSNDREDGQGLVEYVLILGFIAILVIVAMIFFKEQLVSIYSRIGNSIPQS